MRVDCGTGRDAGPAGRGAVGRYAQRGAADARAAGDDRPLLGVPLGIKDVLNVRQQPCTCGSRILKGYTALYDAKNRGRNNYQNYDESMNRRARERLALDQDLRGAVDRGELVLYYQPKVDAVTGEIKGAEALVRWRDPKRGIVSAKKVVSVPDYAKDAWTKLADFYEMTKEWKNAINALRQADSPPGTLFRIARNYERLSSISQAVAQLKEIENFFRNQRASAAMEIAYVYSRAKKKKEEIAALRHIMKKYPDSGHSNTAHERLETLGVRIGGGVDAN